MCWLIFKGFKKMFACCFKDEKKADGGWAGISNVNRNQGNRAPYKEMDNSPEDPETVPVKKGGW